MKFYVNTVTIRVLSEDKPYDFGSYADLNYDLSEGNFVGSLLGIDSSEVSPQEMADLLYDAGSEPNFFMLDDEGNPSD